MGISTTLKNNRDMSKSSDQSPLPDEIKGIGKDFNKLTDFFKEAGVRDAEPVDTPQKWHNVFVSR